MGIEALKEAPKSSEPVENRKGDCCRTDSERRKPDSSGHESDAECCEQPQPKQSSCCCGAKGS